MTPSPKKKWSCPQKFFFPFSPKILLFSKKLLNEKIFKSSFPIKKGYIHFRHQTPPSLQKRLRPQKRFFAVFSENYNFFWKNCLLIIFNTSFVIKKVMLIFGARRHLSLKNCQMRPQNSFSQFFQKILFFFFEKLVE